MRANVPAALFVLTLATGGPACIEIDGGAVELSWSLRSFDGDRVDECTNARIDQVRICWHSIEEGSSTGVCQGSQSFPCGEENGVSGFEIAPGSTSFWIEPICGDGSPADVGSYQVPPPIVRTVEDGKIVTLDSLLIVVTPFGSGCPEAGCTCVRN